MLIFIASIIVIISRCVEPKLPKFWRPGAQKRNGLGNSRQVNPKYSIPHEARMNVAGFVPSDWYWHVRTSMLALASVCVCGCMCVCVSDS